jgi:hypothetical protein
MLSLMKCTFLIANVSDQRYSIDSRSIWLKIQFLQQMYVIRDTVLTANVSDQRYSFDSKCV